MKLIVVFLFVVGMIIFFGQAIPWMISSDDWAIFLLGIIGIPVGFLIIKIFIKKAKRRLS